MERHHLSFIQFPSIIYSISISHDMKIRAFKYNSVDWKIRRYSELDNITENDHFDPRVWPKTDFNRHVHLEIFIFCQKVYSI